MKIIDLLNRIANGENVPKKIKWGCHIYTWLAVEYRALDELGEPLFNEHAGYSKYSLNDEVEIIEEDKKIEKMIKLNNISNPSDMTALCTMQWENNKIIEKKINEIINVINKGDSNV